mmetsp:Transcript_133327/g.371678  ORF Transcript_133327/g.371678 Transcript_133327/m.371678 type:complete len:286 (+) Transcript_133327:676-1533(+)
MLALGGSDAIEDLDAQAVALGQGPEVAEDRRWHRRAGARDDPQLPHGLDERHVVLAQGARQVADRAGNGHEDVRPSLAQPWERLLGEVAQVGLNHVVQEDVAAQSQGKDQVGAHCIRARHHDVRRRGQSVLAAHKAAVRLRSKRQVHLLVDAALWLAGRARREVPQALILTPDGLELGLGTFAQLWGTARAVKLDQRVLPRAALDLLELIVQMQVLSFGQHRTRSHLLAALAKALSGSQVRHQDNSDVRFVVDLRLQRRQDGLRGDNSLASRVLDEIPALVVCGQ